MFHFHTMIPSVVISDWEFYNKMDFLLGQIQFEIFVFHVAFLSIWGCGEKEILASSWISYLILKLNEINCLFIPLEN